MPKLSTTLPKYRKHRASGQAVVTLSGRDHYLGPHGTRASRLEYDRVIGEWLARGRRIADEPESAPLTVEDIIAAYWPYAKQYYGATGKRRGAANNLKPVLRLLRRMYGETPAEEFGPIKLKALREKFVESGQSRRYVNENVGRIKRVFKWAASEELITAEVYHRLQTVDGLRKGRCVAHDHPPIEPVADAVVEQTLPLLSPVVADMVRLQRLTGCRPGEICLMRPCDIDRSDEVWVYRPHKHKTEHHGRERIILIGPRAQAILQPYLQREASAYCFSPAEAEAQRLLARHQRRQTPASCGNRPGTNRRRRPRKTPGNRYTNDSYRRAVHRACDMAFPPPEPLARRHRESVKQWQARLSAGELEQLADWQGSHRWSPNQLRHAAATTIRKNFGLEGAQLLLGHARADVTQIYAERDVARARGIVRQVG